MAWPKGRPRAAKPENPENDCPLENTGETVATKIRFGSVHLVDEVDRLGGSKGLAKASTAYFGAQSGCVIELDVGTGLVHITHAESGAAIVVPRERVKRFEPEVVPAAK